MHTRLPALLLTALALSACGKYGPPVRSAPSAAPEAVTVPQAQAAEADAEQDEAEDGEESPR